MSFTPPTGLVGQYVRVTFDKGAAEGILDAWSYFPVKGEVKITLLRRFNKRAILRIAAPTTRIEAVDPPLPQVVGTIVRTKSGTLAVRTARRYRYLNLLEEEVPANVLGTAEVLFIPEEG